MKKPLDKGYKISYDIFEFEKRGIFSGEEEIRNKGERYSNVSTNADTPTK